MVKPFICGVGSFQEEEEEEDDDPWSLSTARGTKSYRSTNKNKNNKNPYSNRGLDKFAMVLAELDEKRRKIYEQMGSEDAKLVRFGYSSTRDWVPIVVKLKEQKEKKTEIIGKVKNKPASTMNNSEVLDKPQTGSSVSNEVVQEKTKLERRIKNKSLLSSRHVVVKWRRSHIALLMVIVLILICLVVYGKSFAILCTSIWWYLVPVMNQKELNSRKSMKKKDYGRWLSENKMVAEGIKSPIVKCFRRGHSNKSW
ncbi:hypothetical protein IFM89_020364 [Coptis chinensis]|uniref:ZCF37 n=1 Tax=Coptis chinensis TaxID=261450 RepID=A0A835HMD6_9MAGN|nr:hypothetical protein IFM89_020364 [Coptis chinensis]